MEGEIDKDAYFVTKVTLRDEMKGREKLTLLKTEGGFDFYFRSKNN